MYHTCVTQVLYCTAAASLSVTLLRWLGKAPGRGTPSALALHISPDEHAGTAHAMAEALRHLVTLGAAAPAPQLPGVAQHASAHELSVAHG
jgi:hypothetical protein